MCSQTKQDDDFAPRSNIVGKVFSASFLVSQLAGGPPWSRPIFRLSFHWSASSFSLFDFILPSFSPLSHTAVRALPVSIHWARIDRTKASWGCMQSQRARRRRRRKRTTSYPSFLIILFLILFFCFVRFGCCCCCVFASCWFREAKFGSHNCECLCELWIQERPSLDTRRSGHRRKCDRESKEIERTEGLLLLPLLIMLIRQNKI